MFQKKRVEKLKTQILCPVTFFENLAVYEIRWENIVEWSKPQMTIWRMRIACSIPKATNTQSGCVILIAFPLQQWLHERASMFRYTYIASLVMFYFCLCPGFIIGTCALINAHWI